MNPPSEKNDCPYWRILLGEYVLGTIAAPDRARLEKHLASCRPCRRALKETQALYKVLEPYALAAPAAGLADKVTAVLPAAEIAPPTVPQATPVSREPGVTGKLADPPRRSFWRSLRWPVTAPAFAAAAAAAVIAIFVIRAGIPGVTAPVGPAHTEKEPTVAVEGKASAPAPAPITLGSLPDESVAAGSASKDERIETLEETAAPVAVLPPVPVGADMTTARGAPVAAEKSLPAAREEIGFRVVGRDDSYLLKEESERESHTPLATAGGAGGFARVELAADAAKKKGRVEEWMDPRVAADVEKLTGDGAVLLDYVAPNGAVMTYLLELPPDQQRELLSRLKAAETPAAEAEMRTGY